MKTEPATARQNRMNKAGIIAALCEATGLNERQVRRFFAELTTLIGKSLADGGPGLFVIPGLLQIKVVRKSATAERKGINPFTNEEMIVKAKPATNGVKLVPLKGLKSMVQAISPDATTISAEDLQAELDENTNMVSEGGPIY